MNDPWPVTLLSHLPRRGFSTALGAWARRPSRWMARAFVWTYGVDLSEAERPIDAYDSLDALFTRRLKPGARPIDPDPEVIVSPCDGTVAFAGPVDGALPLGPTPVPIEAIVGAPVDVRAAVVIYLAPRDYHRVHAPDTGELRGFRYVRGTRWPVFGAAVRSVPRLFARNERLVLDLHTDRGPVPTVLVGALGVGRIVSPQVGGPRWADVAEPLQAAVSRGDEIGVFHLGSTVMLGLPDLPRRWHATAGEAVRTGRPLARFDETPGAAAR